MLCIAQHNMTFVNEKILCIMQHMTALKDLRKKHGLTGKAFSERMGLNRSYVSLVEHGRENISVKTLEKIAQEFNEPLDELLIAHGYLPDHTKDARQKDPESLNAALKRESKKIMKGE